MSLFSRQTAIMKIEFLATPVTIIGAGTIGSRVTEALASMGFGNLVVYDFDTVSEENIGPQTYSVGDIGKSKVRALSEEIKRRMGFSITSENAYFDKEKSLTSQIVISAVDNMRTRFDIVDMAEEKNVHLIDVRMGGEELHYFYVKRNDEAAFSAYRKSLFPDEVADVEECGAKAIAYTSYMAAALVAKGVKDIVTGEKNYVKLAKISLKTNDYYIVKNEA